MSPLAMTVARELTLPLKERRFNSKAVLDLFDREIHCFDISAIAKPINDAMDEANVWPDVATMLPDLFLPSPVTWLEFNITGNRMAYVISENDGWLHMDVVQGAEPYGVTFGDFRACSILESADRIELKLADDIDPDPECARPTAAMSALAGPAFTDYLSAKKVFARGRASAKDPYLSEKITALRQQEEAYQFDIDRLDHRLKAAVAQRDIIGAANRVIAFSVLAIDLINTPGVVGFRQHAPHTAFAKQFARVSAGSYPLRGWSEVTVKTHTVFDGGDYESGATFRKCLHFVRAHQRHYRDGRTSTVRAHWRGDPALGIKRTRYRVAA